MVKQIMHKEIWRRTSLAKWLFRWKQGNNINIVVRENFVMMREDENG
jgi:hypothetical protein